MRVPHRALRFVGQAAQHAARHGLRRGAAKAAAKANPALLALEAASSVLDALDSYVTLQTARTRRDGVREETRTLYAESAALAAELATLADRLRVERETLAERLAQAHESTDHDAPIRDALARVTATATTAVAEALHAINDAHDHDLPDLDALDALALQLPRAQRRLFDALALYQSPDAP